MILDSWPPELCESKFLLLETTYLCRSVWQHEETMQSPAGLRNIMIVTACLWESTVTQQEGDSAVPLHRQEAHFSRVTQPCQPLLWEEGPTSNWPMSVCSAAHVSGLRWAVRLSSFAEALEPGCPYRDAQHGTLASEFRSGDPALQLSPGTCRPGPGAPAAVRKVGPPSCLPVCASFSPPGLLPAAQNGLRVT